MTFGETGRRKRPGTDPITVNDLNEALKLHSVAERAYLWEVFAELKAAFPDGDFRRHHDYHEQKNKAAQAEEEFWKTAKTTLIQAGVNGFVRLVWIVILLIALGLTVRFSTPDVFTKMLLALLGKE